MRMKLNHIYEADLKTLRSIADRLNDGTKMKYEERSKLSQLIWLIINRIETVETDETHPLWPSGYGVDYD